MEPAEILRKAKEHISDPAMWHKGALFKGDDGWDDYDLIKVEQPDIINGPCCIYGAACWAAERDVEGDVSEALGDALPPGCWSIVDYNDDPSTTHADIMALCDRAIALATPAQETE